MITHPLPSPNKPEAPVGLAMIHAGWGTSSWGHHDCKWCKAPSKEI